MSGIERGQGRGRGRDGGARRGLGRGRDGAAGRALGRNGDVAVAQEAAQTVGALEGRARARAAAPGPGSTAEAAAAGPMTQLHVYSTHLLYDLTSYLNGCFKSSLHGLTRAHVSV